MRTLLVLALLATVAASSSRAAVSPCPLLAAAVHTEPAWSVRLSRHTFTQSGGSWRCELTSVPPKGSVTPTFALVLYFFVSPTPAVAHTNVALLQRKGPPLAGTGADEAFAVEKHESGATNTRATWRKGRYWGWLSVGGPKLAGDREDARDLLGGFTRRLR
jgi:hypothetical protein